MSRRGAHAELPACYAQVLPGLEPVAEEEIAHDLGGEGVVRGFEALSPMEATLLTERRRHGPAGAAGGRDGLPGANLLNGAALPSKISLRLAAGDVLRIETPGGGGWGKGDER